MSEFRTTRGFYINQKGKLYVKQNTLYLDEYRIPEKMLVTRVLLGNIIDKKGLSASYHLLKYFLRFKNTRKKY